MQGLLAGPTPDPRWRFGVPGAAMQGLERRKQSTMSGLEGRVAIAPPEILRP